jgi:effector-binding domain-containing protein
MIDTPRIVQTKRQLAAVIRITVPREEMMKVFGPGVEELIAAVTAQKVGPVGAVFAHHLRMSPKTFDFELGVGVSAPIKPTGRVQVGELPAAKVARTVYHGPYEGLPGAWGEFVKWIKAEGLKPAADLWECYVDGPHSSPDPATWRTELNQPLVG